MQHAFDFAAYDTSAWYALGIPVYLVLMGAEWLYGRRQRREVYGFADTLGNLSCGLGEVLIGLFLGPWLVGLYDWAFAHMAIYRGWDQSGLHRALSWVVAFLAADFGYYVYHRCGHRVALLWCIHGVHHQSSRFNLTIAMRHPWLSDSYSAPFYALLPILGIPRTQFFIAISLISFYALTVHTQLATRPGLGLVTPATHIVHHCRNPRYIGRNLGAMFTFWDRLFGTHVTLRPDDPPDVGTPGGHRSFSGVRAQRVFFEELYARYRQATGWQERLGVLFGPPGRGAGRGLPDVEAEEPVFLMRERLYLVAQVAILVGGSVYLLWWRELHGTAVLLAGVGWVLAGLHSVGAVLDGVPGAWRRERVRAMLTPVALVLLLALGAAQGGGQVQ